MNDWKVENGFFSPHSHVLKIKCEFLTEKCHEWREIRQKKVSVQPQRSKQKWHVSFILSSSLNSFLTNVFLYIRQCTVFWNKSSSSIHPTSRIVRRWMKKYALYNNLCLLNKSAEWASILLWHPFWLTSSHPKHYFLASIIFWYLIKWAYGLPSFS